jgi:hypothetical protein
MEALDQFATGADFTHADVGRRRATLGMGPPETSSGRSKCVLLISSRAARGHRECADNPQGIFIHPLNPSIAASQTFKRPACMRKKFEPRPRQRGAVSRAGARVRLSSMIMRISRVLHDHRVRNLSPLALAAMSQESRPNVARMSQFIPHARMVSIPHAYGLAAKVLASLKFVPGHRGPDRALPIQGMPARIRSAPPTPM